MRRSAAYRAARWAYQPIKALRERLRWWDAGLRREAVMRRLKDAEFIGLQIGAADHYKEGWINTDLPGGDHRLDMPLDITKALPFPDNYFSVIYGSEVIEHVARDHATSFLSEAHRTLRPGGVLRLTTPDIEAICSIYLGTHQKADIDLYRAYWIGGDFSRDIWINAAFRSYGHQFLYSFETLSSELRRVGFEIIKRVEAQQTESHFPQLKQIEQHYGTNGPSELYCSGMIVEATK